MKTEILHLRRVSVSCYKKWLIQQVAVLSEAVDSDITATCFGGEMFMISVSLN